MIRQGFIFSFDFLPIEIQLRCDVNPDPEISAANYTFNCSIVSGSGTPECMIDDQLMECKLTCAWILVHSYRIPPVVSQFCMQIWNLITQFIRVPIPSHV